MKRLLIFGASGLVGKALAEECKKDFEVFGSYFNSFIRFPEDRQFRLGIHEEDKIKPLIHSIEPTVVVSSLIGDFKKQLAFHRQLALDLKDTKTTLYYLSSTNVFDGDLSRHHHEGDTPVSQSDYGNFKIECENILKEILSKQAVIIRIPKMWGLSSPRLGQIKEKVKNKKMIDIFINLESNNLLDTFLARQMNYIIKNELKGVFHLGSVDMINYGDFIKGLVHKLAKKQIEFREKQVMDTNEICYFGLRSKRSDIPPYLQCTNKDIINRLARN